MDTSSGVSVKIPEKATILLVEDDDAAAHLIVTNLRRANTFANILRARHGQEALDILSQGQADGRLAPCERLLMLLDINMPTMNGLDLLRAMKAAPALKRIPVVMLTTSDDPVEIEKSYELGCNFFVTKPVDYAKFVNTIKNIALILQIFTIPLYGDPK